MAKRKSKGKKAAPDQPAAKKPHVEKEDSFIESLAKFKETRAPEDGKFMKKLNKFCQSIQKLETQTKNEKSDESPKISAARMFQPLIHATLIHLCNNPDESLETLQDILTSWSKSRKKLESIEGDSKKSVESRGEQEEEEKGENEEPAWADVAVDAVICMLPSCNNRCLRLFLQGLKRVTNHTTLNVVESITAPLTGLDDEDSSDEDEDNDDTMETGAEANESASDDDVDEAMEQDVSGDEDEWEEIEEEGEEETKELEKLKAKLHGILFSSKSDNRSGESSGAQVPQDDDESENEADDEAMFALDDAIAQAFKEKFASKKSVLDAKAETFKCRMLKLIQCYASHRERKEQFLIQFTISILPLIKAVTFSREFKSRLIETLSEIFDVKNKKTVPVEDQESLESLGEIFKHLIEQASKAKSPEESTLYAKGINWALKIRPSPLADALAESANVSTLTSATFVTLSHIASRATALQLLNLLVNLLTSGEKEELKPLQLAHAYEIISHAIAKFLQNNGRDELPSTTFKQVWSLTKDKATQLSSQMNDGKCNWLLLSSVIQTLNYLKIIFSKNSQTFTLDKELIESFKNITGKNRKKLPKPGQIALKGLLSGSKSKKNKPVGDKIDENTPAANTKGPPSNKSQVKKSKIPLPRGKIIKPAS